MGSVLGSLDPAKILVVLVFALIVLGPERLPRAARQVGAFWRELSRIREQVREEVHAAIPQVDIPRIPAGAVSGFLRDLTSTPGTGVELEHEAGGLASGEHVAAGSLSRTAPSAPGPAGALLDETAVVAVDDPGMN